AFLSIFCLGSNTAFAKSVSFPNKPTHNRFVVDQADMLATTDLQEINQIAKTLLMDEQIPIYVVTINSLAEFKTPSMSIDLYAQKLFDNWGIGYKNRNYGMLLVISKSDRRMRIELGQDWAGKRDKEAEFIINRVMQPRFKDGYFSEGITEGVKGMDGMARGMGLPSPYYQWWVVPALVCLALLTLFISISMFRSGKTGIGWALLVALFVIIMFIIDIITSPSSGDNSVSGFGGGSSGGGGASGGW
ncbi:MAG: TPM domain-containing protein, partial [Litorimonas sp.]